MRKSESNNPNNTFLIIIYTFTYYLSWKFHFFFPSLFDLLFNFFPLIIGANWCVCKSGISEKELQKTLDYACGAGADCNPTHSGGACFNPNTVQAHCSYAVNSYFQRKGQAQGTCDFSGTATVVTSDPSKSTKNYPLFHPLLFLEGMMS